MTIFLILCGLVLLYSLFSKASFSEQEKESYRIALNDCYEMIAKLNQEIKKEHEYNIALHSILRRYEKLLGENQVNEVLDEILENIQNNGDNDDE